jgi:hypothetical protein
LRDGNAPNWLICVRPDNVIPLSESCYFFFDEDFLLGILASALRNVPATKAIGLAIPQPLFPQEYEVVQ